MSGLQQVLGNLNRWANEKKIGFDGLGRITAGKAERYAKLNRPWTDRSREARRRLKGQHFWETDTQMKVAIAHGVDYGVYLELANDGKYAILEPTMNEVKDEFYRQAERIFNK